MNVVNLPVLALLLQLSSNFVGALKYCNSSSDQTDAIYTLYENETRQYHSLQEALSNVSTNNQGAPTVCLPQGRHIITKQTEFHESNIVLIGTQGTVIECDYNSLPLEEMFDYTWHFNQSRVVHFENIAFLNCPFPYRLVAVKSVTIQDCIFSNFSEAVLDLFNCEIIRLERSFFHNNSGTGILFERFRGNTGAVALGYNNYPHFLCQPHVTISNSEFVNNSALATFIPFSTERAVSSNVFNGRGGGLGIFIGESSHNVTLNMTNCKFTGNYGRFFGGGMYIYISSYNTQLFLTFTRINIIGNRAQRGGGGVLLAFLSATNTYTSPDTVVFEECEFENNIGESGGGIYVFTSFIGAQGFYFKLDSCHFNNNSGFGSVREFGAAIAVALLVAISQQRVTAERHDIRNCTFTQNSGRNGIVSIGYSPIKFSGKNVFKSNSGASIRIVGSLVDFFDEVVFEDNTDSVEGSLSMLSFGQLRVHEGLRILFNGNTGRLGASITVTTPNTLSAFSNLLYNPACFTIYQDSLIAPFEWENVTMRFDQNEAVLGSALYFSRVGHCSWFSQSSPYFRKNVLQDWPIWKFGNNTSTGYSDPHNSSYYIGTHTLEILASVSQVNSWPGQRFSMSITGIDQFRQITSANARLFEISDKTPLINFDPEIVVIAGSSKSGLLTEGFTMTYSVASEEALHELVNRSGITIGMEEPFQTLSISATSFSLRAEFCPGGYELVKSVASAATSRRGLTCQCLEVYETVKCEDDQDGVIVKDGLWAGFVTTGSPNLFFHPCPPGYCQCTLNSSLGPGRCVYKYNHSNKDLQCNNKREGLLCGSCKNSSGVSVLLDKCVSCSNGYIALLFVLILCDILAFVIIKLIDRPVPQWIYPFIFYVQMAPFISANFPESFETLGVYMTYANSALGFYFIYDFCLLNSLPPLASYFIRYIPFILALVVCASIRIIREYCLVKKSLNYHGYWLITLLLYPHLVHTSISILNCSQIPDAAGSYAARWYVDASVQCFTGWHAPLALFSIAVLLGCLLSVFFVMFATIKKQECLKKYVSPLTAAYMEECRCWAGIDFGRRLLFLIILTLSQRNTVYTTLFLVIILAMYSYLLPYKSRVANAVEVTLLLNMLVLMLLEATPLIKELLFTFDAVVIVSPISWLLFIFYYLPAVVLIGVIIGLVLPKLFRCCKKGLLRESNHNIQGVNETSLSSTVGEFKGTITTSHIISLDECEGESPIMVDHRS